MCIISYRPLYRAVFTTVFTTVFLFILSLFSKKASIFAKKVGQPFFIEFQKIQYLCMFPHLPCFFNCLSFGWPTFYTYGSQTYYSVKLTYRIFFKINSKADIRNPRIQLCWILAPSSWTQIASQFIRWGFLSPSDTSIPLNPHLMLHAFEDGGLLILRSKYRK